jgi:hypothetical protein
MTISVNKVLYFIICIFRILKLEHDTALSCSPFVLKIFVKVHMPLPIKFNILVLIMCKQRKEALLTFVIELFYSCKKGTITLAELCTLII